MPAGAIFSIFQTGHAAAQKRDRDVRFHSFEAFFFDCICLQKKKVLQEEAVLLLRSDNTVFDKALVLCQMHNFKEGILYLYEKGKL